MNKYYSGGGSYDDEGVKIGNWVEIWDGFDHDNN